MEPICITGLGCISGLGIGRAAFQEAVFEGRTALGPITAFDTSTARSHVAATIPNFDPAQFIAPAKLRRIDRVGRLAVASCKLALGDADLLDRQTDDDEGIGVVFGSYTAGLHSVVDYLDNLNAHGPAGASALDFSNTVGNAAASLCGIEFSLHGANVTLNYKEASSLAAIAYAMTLVDSRRMRAIVTGGVDDFESVFFLAHDEFGVLAFDQGCGEAARPFDRRRNGFVLGNGSFLAVIESQRVALDRGVHCHAAIVGVGATASSCRLNAWPEDAAQLERCMREALRAAELSADAVGVVFASANSTRQLDRVEAAALSSVFGPRGVPVVALKGAVGESGAAGAAALFAAVAALERGQVPPSPGFEQADPDCEVDVTPVGAVLPRLTSPVALINSFASGGANYSLVVRS